MNFAVVSTEEFFIEFEKLNYSKVFELTKIPKKSMVSLIKEFETDNAYDLIFLDIKELSTDNESICKLLERISRTKECGLVVVANGYLPKSAFIKDMIESGAKHVITGETAGLKKEILDILVFEGLWNTKKAATEKKADFLLEKGSVPTTNNDTGYIEEKQDPPEVRPLGAPNETIVPPSQVPRSVAKARIPKKPTPSMGANKALTIAFAGAGERIGTTTQLMQMALYLLVQEETVAIMQIYGDVKLDAYIGILESRLVNEDLFVIDGIDIYRSGKSIAKAKEKYDYLLFDYGNFNVLSDVTSFLDKDICVIVGGIKPSEIDKVDNVFDYDDGSLFYIFSFVPQNDKQAVLDKMDSSADKTFFASYAPDYWQYCGDDKTYSALLSCAVNPSSKRKNVAKKSFLSKIPFLNM